MAEKPLEDSIAKIVNRRSRLLASLPPETAGLNVIDVIFFPELNHSPMVRLEGAGLSEAEASLLEASHPSITVRQESLGSLLDDGTVECLVVAGYADRPTPAPFRKDETELTAAALAYLHGHGIGTDGLLLWELDLDDERATIRLAGPTDRPPVTFDDGRVTVEFVSVTAAAPMRALLGYFDHCKQSGRAMQSSLKAKAWM